MKQEMFTIPMIIAILAVAHCGGSQCNERETTADQSSEVEEAQVEQQHQEEAAAVDLSDCGSLNRTQCLGSPQCTLVVAQPVPHDHPEHRNGNYLCRPAEGHCEQGFIQSGMFGIPESERREMDERTAIEAERAAAAQARSSCLERPGCQVTDNDCYCQCRGMGRTTLEDGEELARCDCFCAGGAPPSCVSEDGTAAASTQES